MTVAIYRADLRKVQGDVEGALLIQRKALDELGAAGNPPVSSLVLIELLTDTGQSLTRLGRTEEADAFVERLQREAVTWEQASGWPIDARRSLYRSLVFVGDGAQDSGKASPLPYFARALAALARWREAAPGDRAVDREEAQLSKRIGAIELDEHRYAEAAVSLTRASLLARRIVDEDATDAVSWQIRLESSLVRAEVEQRLGHAGESERYLAEGEELAGHVVKTFPREKEAWLARCRVALTRGALDTVAGEAESDTGKARALLEKAALETLDGGALYREAVNHGIERSFGEGVAMLCDAEVARLRKEIAVLGAK